MLGLLVLLSVPSKWEYWASPAIFLHSVKSHLFSLHKFSCHLLAAQLFFNVIMIESNQPMTPSPQHHEMLRISWLLPDSTASERKGSDISCNSPFPPHTDRPLSFSTHCNNIHGRPSNPSLVDQHLSSTSFDILLLSEAHLFNDVLSSLFLTSNYNLHSWFQFKGVVCAYFNINTPVACL